MKKLTLILCGISILGSVMAQTAMTKAAAPAKMSEAAASSESAAMPPIKTLLWEISGNGLQKPSYLFGTMHLLCADAATLSDTLKQVIRQAGSIYFEIDMDNLTEMMGALQYLKMNDNRKLQDLLTPEEYTRIKNYFTHNPAMLPLQMMETLKPYFIASLISEQKMTCAVKGGMEQVIMEEAKKYKKEINGLETVKFQASVFDSIPYVEQAHELLKTIDSADQNSRQEDELVAVYKQQDLDKIEELTNKEEGGVASHIDLLLYNRNTDWVQKLARILPANNILLAVGAAHLPGEKGIINLLRKTGYTVRPVKNE